MLQPGKNRRRHNSSIFELHPESMVLADILDALKTQPQEHSSPTIQFLSRMLTHLKELCLTKASTFAVQSLTQTHVRSLLSAPLPQALTLYFRDLVPEVDRLISRLKRVNHKKFTILIRRKISEMFSEIMRHAYDLKMGVLAERIRQRQIEKRAGVVLKGLVGVLEARLGVADGWRRLRAVTRDQRRSEGRLVDKWRSTIGNLELLARKRNAKLKLGYVNLWHLNTKQVAYECTTQIHNLVKTIYLSSVDAIEDECQIHSLVNLSLRRISQSEASEFRYHRPVDSLMVSFGQLSDTPTYTEATEKQLECLERRTVVFEESAQLMPVGEIGVFRVPTERDMSAKTLESLLVLANGLGDILKKIYSIRSRLEYYNRDCRSLNQLAQHFCQRYLQLQSPECMPALLDDIFQQAEFSHFQIMFLEDSHHQSFYKYSSPESTIQQLTTQAILMLRDEFQKPNAKPYLQISRSSTSSATFTIFPIYEETLIKGLIKFGYPFELPTDGLVESLKVFVDTLIVRGSSGKEEGQSERDSHRVLEELQTPDSLKSGLEITNAATYEDIAEAVANAARKIVPRGYCCLLWPVKQPAQCFWTPLGDQILTIQWVSSLARSPTPYQDLSLPQHQELVQFMKKFPLSDTYRLFEYQHPQQKFRVVSIPIRSRLNEVLGLMLVGEIETEECELELHADNLLQVAGYLKARVKQQGGGLTWREEHNKIQLKEFHAATANFHIQYQCFEECLDRLFCSLYGPTETRVFTVTSKCLLEHNGPAALQLPECLPSSPYCSHNHLLFSSTSVRFRNKVSVKSNKTSLLFRSQQLRQRFFNLFEMGDELNDSAIGDSNRQINALERILGLEKQYVYVPISQNAFVLILNQRKWTESEVISIQKYLKKEFLKAQEFRKNVLLEKREIAFAEIRSLRKSFTKWQLNQTLKKFQENRAFKQRRVEILKNIVTQNMDKKSLLYSYYRFREVSSKYNQFIISTQNKLHNLKSILNNVYLNNTIKLIKEHSETLLQKEAVLCKSFCSIQRLLARQRSCLVRHSFSRVHQLSTTRLLTKNEQRNRALYSLSTLICKKQRNLYRFAMESIDERWKQFNQIFIIVAEELRLVSFDKQSAMLEFVQQRLTEPIKRLPKPLQKTVFEVQIVPKSEFKCGKNYLVLRQSAEAITVGWELSNGTFLAITVSSKLKLEGLFLENILELKQSLVRCHSNIVTTLTSKLSCLASAINNLYVNNLQTSLKTLSRNVLKCIHNDNKKSKISLRQIQGQLSDLANQTQIHKENESISKELNECRKQIGALQDEFATLKIQNQLKRKTLVVSLMMGKFEEQRDQREKTTKFMIDARLAATDNRVQSQRGHEKAQIDDLKIRRYGVGTNMFSRFVKTAKGRVCKEAFESMLSRAYRQLSFLR